MGKWEKQIQYVYDFISTNYFPLLQQFNFVKSDVMVFSDLGRRRRIVSFRSEDGRVKFEIIFAVYEYSLTGQVEVIFTYQVGSWGFKNVVWVPPDDPSVVRPRLVEWFDRLITQIIRHYVYMRLHNHFMYVPFDAKFKSEEWSITLTVHIDDKPITMTIPVRDKIPIDLIADSIILALSV